MHPNPNIIEINPLEGMLNFVIKDGLAYCPGVTELVFGHDAPDGSAQLRVWKLWNNKYRLEFVTRQTGRSIINTDAWLLSKHPSRFSAIWSQKENEFCISVDGKWYHEKLLIN